MDKKKTKINIKFYTKPGLSQKSSEKVWNNLKTHLVANYRTVMLNMIVSVAISSLYTYQKLLGRSKSLKIKQLNQTFAASRRVSHKEFQWVEVKMKIHTCTWEGGS